MSTGVPSYEKYNYIELHKIYKELSDLKNNRNTYINSKQVYEIYDNFLTQLHELSLTRKDVELRGISLSVPNESDSLVDDIWQLVSLCFLTCGLVKFAPATYSSLTTVEKLLDHLRDCQVYTIDDITPIRERLNNIRDIIEAGELRFNNEYESDIDAEEKAFSQTHKIEESLALRQKLKKCEVNLHALEEGFKQLPPEFEVPYNELTYVRRELLAYLTDSVNPPLNSDQLEAHLEELSTRVKAIENQRDEDGKFISTLGTEEQINQSQMVLKGLLDDCHNFLSDLSIQRNTNNISAIFENLSLDEIDSEISASALRELQHVYGDLIAMKMKLENLLITRRWTMRETDLYIYQKQLREIDVRRLKSGSSLEENLQKTSSRKLKSARRLQLLILYLLRRCYSLIYKLLESSEPVLESLQPIHNQLSTVRRCLLEIKRVEGLNNLRDIYPFQFKLASLDNLRNDGKFIVNGQIPEGQGTLNALLAECFDILHELKIELEEKEESLPSLHASSSSNVNGPATDEEYIESDDEVELKRKRYHGLNVADYDSPSPSESSSMSCYESNDYY